MSVAINLLIWLHLVGLGLGMGGGFAMAQVGPRLIAASPEDRATWQPLANRLARLSDVGLGLLIVTGPLVLWLKYAGGGGVNGWFHLKLALVVLAVIAVGVNRVGMARFRRGDASGARLMMIAGPATGLAVLAAMLAAVFAFG